MNYHILIRGGKAWAVDVPEKPTIDAFSKAGMDRYHAYEKTYQQAIDNAVLFKDSDETISKLVGIPVPVWPKDETRRAYDGQAQAYDWHKDDWDSRVKALKNKLTPCPEGYEIVIESSVTVGLGSKITEYATLKPIK